MMMMMVVVVVVMTVLLIMVMAVVFATVGRGCQLSLEIRCHELFHGRAGEPGTYGDPMLGEVGQGTFADASGNDHCDALPAQPPGERARLMFGRRQHLGLQRSFLVGIHLDHRKLAATAEVAVKVTVFNGNGYFHKQRDTWFVMVCGRSAAFGVKKSWKMRNQRRLLPQLVLVWLVGRWSDAVFILNSFSARPASGGLPGAHRPPPPSAAALESGAPAAGHSELLAPELAATERMQDFLDLAADMGSYPHTSLFQLP